MPATPDIAEGPMAPAADVAEAVFRAVTDLRTPMRLAAGAHAVERLSAA